jgi:predicted Zn-dependent peptidase
VARTSRDYVPLLVMNTILGGMFSSRINLNLREAHAYTYGARSSFAWRRGAGPFTIGGAIAAPSTAPAVQEIFNELRRIRDTVVTDEELLAAKARLTESLPARFETGEQTAAAVADLFVYGLPLDEYATLTARVNAITPAEVQRVARQYLDVDHARVVVVGDATLVAPGLEALGLGNLALRDAWGERPATPPTPPLVPPPTGGTAVPTPGQPTVRPSQP